MDTAIDSIQTVEERLAAKASVKSSLEPLPLPVFDTRQDSLCPALRVKSWGFANTPAGANRINQRRVVMLSHLPTRIDDPKAKALLALVSERQHVAGDVRQDEGREHQTLAAHLVNHVHGIGRAVDGDEGAGEVAILVVRVGKQMPHGEQVSALSSFIDELRHPVTSTSS